MTDLERSGEQQRLPAIIEYLRAEQARADREQGVIHVHFHEAVRPEPVPPPPPDVLVRFAPYLVLATWSAVVLAGVAVVFVMIAGALMTIMISTALCSVAVAASVRSLRQTKEEARTYARARKGR
jgi:hypothetical protein